MRKELQTFAGKCSRVANMLMAWKPFLEPLWAAIYSKKPTRAVNRGVWKTQVLIPLRWIYSFLSHTQGTLTRSWLLSSFLGQGPRITFILDASPWGLGGILLVQGVITSWFMSRLTMTDQRMLNKKIGDSTGQQTWELLCVLVALRIWHDWWCNNRAQVHVKSDNIAALIGAANLRGKAGLILRELSYTYSLSSFEPAVSEHVPGVCNSFADCLSRWWEPGVAQSLPALLKPVPRASAPPRKRHYYKTLVAEQDGW